MAEFAAPRDNQPLQRREQTACLQKGDSKLLDLKLESIGNLYILYLSDLQSFVY